MTTTRSVIANFAISIAPGIWSSGGVGTYIFGDNSDIPVVADYDGDGKDEVAIFRPSNSLWYIVGRGSAFVWDTDGDIPVPADYNGDGKDEVAIFRTSNGTWYISSLGNFLYGMAAEIPILTTVYLSLTRTSRREFFTGGSFVTASQQGVTGIPMNRHDFCNYLTSKTSCFSIFHSES